MSDYYVAALYRFVDFSDYQAWQEPLQELCRDAGVKGTLLLAKEGINGTIAGSESGVRRVLDRLRQDARFADLQPKISRAAEMPFHRMKVRLKKEIVTMGVDGIDPNQLVGTYVDPLDWNAMLEDPGVTVIDTRNDYEVAIGSFAGARNPSLGSFREFPEWLKAEVQSGQKVAMFCTGGIRCEKSTAYLKQLGVGEVFHLAGGILKYLENVPEDESLWQGECFVFDERVAVKHGLAAGSYGLCRSCRYPINASDRARPEFEEGVSCHHCFDKTSDARKASCRERRKQVELAQQRGQQHLGDLDS
ncbi:MAG: rhodanese-related sulfurtransferase [Planctomycetota bacterium]